MASASMFLSPVANRSPLDCRCPVRAGSNLQMPALVWRSGQGSRPGDSSTRFCTWQELEPDAMFTYMCVALNAMFFALCSTAVGSPETIVAGAADGVSAPVDIEY